MIIQASYSGTPYNICLHSWICVYLISTNSESHPFLQRNKSKYIFKGNEKEINTGIIMMLSNKAKCIVSKIILWKNSSCLCTSLHLWRKKIPGI